MNFSNFNEYADQILQINLSKEDDDKLNKAGFKTSMPSGWKWGDQGKCYTGPEGKKKAIKQGVAIEGPEKFSQKVKAGDVQFTENEYELIDDSLTQAGLGLGDRIAYAIDLKRYLK